MCLVLFHPAKKLETVNTASANVTSLLITLPAPDDQAVVFKPGFHITVTTPQLP